MSQETDNKSFAEDHAYIKTKFLWYFIQFQLVTEIKYKL